MEGYTEVQVKVGFRDQRIWSSGREIAVIGEVTVLK